jgi:4-hydroxy-tetrahydrodipicolinate synthase
MTGFGYPELLVKVYERFAAGRIDDAFDLYEAYLPLIRYERQFKRSRTRRISGMADLR